FYCRGEAQLADCFAMLCIANGIDEATFRSAPRCYSICNTNSPLQLDVPMTDGIIDFAANGQLMIVTPFTLAGAMAPITISRGLPLHAARCRLARRRADGVAREIHPRRRNAADVRGALPAGARFCRGDRRRGGRGSGARRAFLCRRTHHAALP